MTGKLKPWLVLAVIFIAGVLSGVALTIVLGPRLMRLGHPPGPAQMEKHIMARLTRELSLTPDQQTKIQPIIGEAAKELQEVHHDEIQRVSQIIKLTNDQMTPILTPEQKAQLDKLIADGQNSFSGHKGWGPPGDMPFHGGPFDNGAPPPPPGPPPALSNQAPSQPAHPTPPGP